MRAPDTRLKKLVGARGQHPLAFEPSAGSIAEAMLPKLFWAKTVEAGSAAVSGTRQAIERNPPEGIAAALRGMAERPNVTPDLAKIKTPTLVVVGEHDVISTVDEMRGIAGEIPGAEFVVIPNAGHMAPLENPTAFNTALDKFLARI